MSRNVALKVEKKDKNKNILKFEYSVINCLKGKADYLVMWYIHIHIGLKHVCSAYDFVVNPEQNLIVMDLLGKFV